MFFFGPDTFPHALLALALRPRPHRPTRAAIRLSRQNSEYLILALIQHTFTVLVPLPEPPGTPAAERCLWHAASVRYETQLDVLILLQRLIEHFAAAAFTVDHTRPIDAVRMVVPLCIAAVADALLRKVAVDIPSIISLHLVGGGVGAELGQEGRGYALSSGALARQAATIVVFSPELNIARARALDYFEAAGRDCASIFNWDRTDKLEPSVEKLVGGLCAKLAFGVGEVLTPQYVADRQGLLHKNYPEFLCYRDIAFYAKLFLNPQLDRFPSGFSQWTQREAELQWQWDSDYKRFRVQAFEGTSLSCRPRLRRGEMPPKHRWALAALCAAASRAGFSPSSPCSARAHAGSARCTAE